MAVVCGLGVMVPIDRDLQAGEVANLLERSGVSAVFYSGKKGKLLSDSLDILRGNEDLQLPDAIVIDPVVSGEDIDELGASFVSEEGGDIEASTLSALVREGRQMLAQGQKAYLDLNIDPKELCVILYTSGTMGMAKGVMLGHQQIVANVYNMSKRVNV